MPIFEFRCPAGHQFDDFFAPAPTYPRVVKCAHRGCKRRAKKQISLVGPPTGALEKNDVATHFNPAFGTVVKNRKHMRELQRKHGTQDWRPVKDREPTRDMLKRTGKSGRYGTA